MFGQATVYQYRAEFAMNRAAREGRPASDVAAEVDEQLQARRPFFLPSFFLPCAFLSPRPVASLLLQVACLLARSVGQRNPGGSRAPPAPPAPASSRCPPAPPLRPLLAPPQKAEAQHDAALAYKPTFLDGFLGKSTCAQMRGKLAAGLLVTPSK